jgi:hypothetical protein
MTPRGLRWASIAVDMLCLMGLGFALALTSPLWLPYLGIQAWRQRLELEMPDPIKKQRTAHLIATEDKDGPRNRRH